MGRRVEEQAEAMIDPSDVPTIEQILDDYSVSDYLDPNQFQALLDELKNRENIMVTDFARKAE